jgi:hypothetical protein
MVGLGEERPITEAEVIGSAVGGIIVAILLLAVGVVSFALAVFNH